MDDSDKTQLTNDQFDAPLEHIELESNTGRFRRDSIRDAVARAEAEVLANKRRDLRIDDDALIVSYAAGESPKKFSLFGRKKCKMIDASINGMGIEAAKGMQKDDKVTLTISDGKRGDVPEFEIVATIRYVGVIDKKRRRYGLQYDYSPTMAYSECITKETLRRKIAKVQEQNSDAD